MRYSYEFKLHCIELYRQGRYPETPQGLSEQRFHKTIRRWVRTESNCGPEALKHKGINKQWTAEERFELVAQVLAGNSCNSVALANGISSGLLYQWVRKYTLEGYEGLESLKQGRRHKEPSMKKKDPPKELTPSEKEELLRLRARVAYLEAENEVIKKEIALREQRWDEQ
ncbi:MAG: helix-turn-helix domain-containing protein, partial [Firmicutes bacterium]|nr:helix-turn-helix domain-containing protein [Bacillota bacterium]